VRLVKTRDCDGACCLASPRFPKENGEAGCEYSSNGTCQILDGNVDAPAVSPTQPHLTGAETVELTCNAWPHNTPDGRGTGDECCWQWGDD